MPSMTVAMGDLAQSITRLRRDRADATTRRRREPNERTALMASQLNGFRTSRAEHAARQRRQLSAFMTGLTASVGTMRDLFRTNMASMRVAQRSELSAFVSDLTVDVESLLTGFRSRMTGYHSDSKARSKAVQEQMNEYRRDRHGANDAWSVGQPTADARPAAAHPEPTTPAHPAVAVDSGFQPAAKAAEPAPFVVAPAPKPPMTASTPPHVPSHETRPRTTPQPQSLGPARGSGGTPTPTNGGKPS